MRAHKVDLGLRDGSHPDLIKRASEESGKSATEDDVPVPARQTDPHSRDVLLCYETLNITLIKCLLIGEGEGGVFSIPI